MKCLLVQDVDVEKSSATMYVATGNLSDPKGSEDGSRRQIDGLAHFCEHMLFLGTKKYPDENHYSKFVSAHGG